MSVEIRKTLLSELKQFNGPTDAETIVSQAKEAEKINNWLIQHRDQMLKEPLEMRNALILELGALYENLENRADLIMVARASEVSLQRSVELTCGGIFMNLDAKETESLKRTHDLMLDPQSKVKRTEKLNLEAPQIEKCLATIKNLKNSLNVKSRCQQWTFCSIQ